MIHFFKSGKLRQGSVATLQIIFGWRSVKVLPPWATIISGRLIPAPGAALLNVFVRSSELRCQPQALRATLCCNEKGIAVSCSTVKTIRVTRACARCVSLEHVCLQLLKQRNLGVIVPPATGISVPKNTFKRG